LAVCRRTSVAASRDGTLIQPGQPAVADLSDLVALKNLLDNEQPAVIVNAAAYTAVDKAEQEAEAADRINGEALGVIGRWAHAHHALVVHYSTDYVFDGDADSPYAPSAATAPQGAYGRSKLQGEQALRDSGASHMIFRTAWVYSPIGHNFLRTMLRLGAERNELRVVADQRGTPTTTSLIVAGTLAALDKYFAASDNDRKAFEGTFHLTATGETTWHGFAEAIFAEAAIAGLLVKSPSVHAIESSEFPTPAKRPSYSVLDNTSFSHTFGYALKDWREGLRETVRALSKQ